MAKGKKPAPAPGTRQGKARKGGQPAKAASKTAAAPAQAAGAKSNVPTRGAVADWVRMMVDPANAEIVSSPAGVSSLACRSKIVHKFDIPYANTIGGSFAVVARPTCTDPAIVFSQSAREPVAGTALIDMNGRQTFGNNTGLYSVGSATNLMVSVTVNGISVASTASLGIPLSGGSTYLGLEIVGTVTSYRKCSAMNSGAQTIYVQLYQRNAGAWANVSPSVAVPAHGQATVFDGWCTAHDAVALVRTDGTVPQDPTRDSKIQFHLSESNAYLPAPTVAGARGAFVKDDLVERASVSNTRVTAMSLLVTNMAPATKDGGELVMACTRQKNAYATSVANMMARICALPEENRWRSGIIRDGGYAFYCPDDLESYEPRPYADQDEEDNCCIAAGILSDGGVVRVVITWVVEWYTPVQLFERRMGPAWNDHYRLALRYLQVGRMVSANDEHTSMVAQIASRVKDAWKWMLAHRAELEAAGAVAGQLAALL